MAETTAFLLSVCMVVVLAEAKGMPVPLARHLLDRNSSMVILAACNKTGRWPALFLTFPLPCGGHFITLHYSTLPWGGLFITLHYSTLLGTLFLTLLYMCALYGGRW